MTTLTYAEKQARMLEWLADHYRPSEYRRAANVLRRRADACGRPDVARLFRWAAAQAEAMQAGRTAEA